MSHGEAPTRSNPPLAPAGFPPPEAVFRIDEAACLKGGEMAGQYLEEIGKTDLASFTPAEWSLFCQKLVGFTFMFAASPPPNDTPPF